MPLKEAVINDGFRNIFSLNIFDNLLSGNLLVLVSPFPLMQFQVRFTDIFGANRIKVKIMMRSK